MICKKCGFENMEESKFCNKCGTRLEETEDIVNENNLIIETRDDSSREDINSIRRKEIIKKLINRIPIKNKVFSITIATFLTMSLFISIFYVYNKDLYTFKNLFNDKEYSQAQKYYSDLIKTSSDSKKENLNKSIKNYFVNEANKIKVNYIKDSNKNDCKAELDILANMISYKLNDNELNQIKDYITELGASRDSYIKGTEALKNNNYLTATLNYKKVIEDDRNYNDVQEKLKEILPQLKNQQIDAAEKYFTSKDYDKAIASIQAISQYFNDDSELNDKLSVYKSEKEKQDKLIKQQKESRKNELLSYVEKYTDKVSNNIMYVPKPYGSELNIPRNGVILYPYLRGEIGSDVFKLIAGFNKEDWIFMKKIVCNADGEIFEINFGYFDRKSEVGFGSGIYEWIEVPSFDTISINSDQNPKLLENLNKLGKANSAAIKFQGDTKSFDYTLTQAEKNTLVNMIELHNISKN